jgi:RNA polymerase sigma factor (sigma-70 family)
VNTLTEALAADLDAGFSRLVDATRDRVYALALSLTRSPHDAEDVAQEAFVRAYKALRSYAPSRIRALQPRAWLAKIALNVWRNRTRGIRREAVELDERWPADSRDEPHVSAERSAAARDLRALLSRLPERYRVAVVLRHAYDVPYGEAAAALGIPVGTLKANVHRGTRMLREAFDRRKKAV